MANKEMKINSVVGNQAFWIINKKLYREIGLEATLLLQHFCDLEENIFNGAFFQQQERIMKEFSWSRKKVEDSIKCLVDKKFLTVEKKGLPMKNYYTINHVEIASFLFTETKKETPHEV